MNDTPGKAPAHEGEEPRDETAASSARPDAWKAPEASLRHPTGPTEQLPAGAPPFPGVPPEPLSQTPAAPPVAEGAHRAPASLDHAGYAGPNSTAYANLAAADAAAHGQHAAQEGFVEAGAESGYTGPGESYSYDASNATAAGGWTAPATLTRRKRGLGSFVAVAIVAAVIGALVATGGYALFASRADEAAAGPSGNLTIGHYNDATVVTAVAAKATPSVVTINVSSGSSAGTGSGVILTSDGYIVTNTHVITLDGASATGTISVTLSNGKIYTGKLKALDPLVDLAVIKIDATGLNPITFADSSKLNVGDTAVAIGAPLGLSNTVTDGIISTLNRSITVQSSAVPSGGDSGGSDNNGQGPFSFDNGQGSTSQATGEISLPVIQTDAPINPGNSGGALLNSKGDLVGINVAIASAGGSSSDGSSASGSIGVGFSIPANLVKRVADDIIKDGYATHGLLGASVEDATSDSSATHTGALIKSLTSGGAAEKAGLRAGDVITEFDGIPITGATDITAQVRTLAGGSTASITYIRDGASKTTTVTLGTLKS